jgi:ABC-type glycerol-3-phosphate transport system permease component
MPVISRIGARSLKVRFVYTTIFVVLVVGAVSMVYPLLLMLSGSVKSDTDIDVIGPYPRYWFDDHVLFQKYVESKYNMAVRQTEDAWCRQIGSWRQIEPPAEVDAALLDDFLAWRAQCSWWWLGHTSGYKMLPHNGLEFRRHLIDRFEGSLAAMRKRLDAPHSTWNLVAPPGRPSHRYPLEDRPFPRAFAAFAAARPVADRIIENPEGLFLSRCLVPAYTNDIARYNEAHGTTHESYDKIFLAARAPQEPLQRRDWERFVREMLPVQFIHIDRGLEDRYRRFVAGKYGAVEAYNQVREGVRLTSFDEVDQPLALPHERIDQVDFLAFARDGEACPTSALEVQGPRQAFERFVAARRGVPGVEVAPIRLPIAAADWHDCMADTGALRRRFTWHNYRIVLDYILLHGRGIVNTLIYCALAVGLALIVNPLAAYALSRYKPPSTYSVLLFCIATMAFPGEVTMIPSFLLLKRFPMWPLIGGGAAFIVSFWMLGRALRNLPELVRVTLSLGIAIVAGAWAVPAIIGQAHISLLNTFAALVLPGLANGYMIFLLKGFFDSLPQELYEAAEIDGAGGWTKFWSLTMNLSKPILAVLGLGAFTGAYSAFMMALIVIPDEKMWTIMVWLFQLQHNSHQAVVYASLVIAAIPTLLVFVFCQGIILRGIVVPIEK